MYKKEGLTCCPACGSDDIILETMELFDEILAIEDGWCPHCNAVWRNKYHISNIELEVRNENS